MKGKADSKGSIDVQTKVRTKSIDGKQRKYLGLPLNQFILVCCFIIPSFIHLAIFWLGVQITAIGQGFTDQETGVFTLNNYKYLFEVLAQDNSTLRLAFANTFKYFIKGLVMIPVSLFSAYMFYKKMPGHMFVRVVLFIPPTVASLLFAYAYKYMISDISPVIQWLRRLGIDIPKGLLLENGTTMIMIFDIWMGICGNMIIWFGTMSRIPEEITEYAIFDGVTPMQEFIHITIPLIWPTVVTVTMFALMGIFSASGSVLVLTNGQYGTTTFAFWQYESIYKAESYGYQNRVVAVQQLIALATLPIVFGGRWIMNKFGSEVEY